MFVVRNASTDLMNAERGAGGSASSRVAPSVHDALAELAFSLLPDVILCDTRPDHRLIKGTTKGTTEWADKWAAEYLSAEYLNYLLGYPEGGYRG